jgi:negative modulator of initiation of replication
MNKQKAADFGKVLDIKGSNRAYFSADKQTLLDTGKSTNPKQIPGSDFWVVTNNNTQRKADLLCKVATILGFAESDISALGSIL